jgi:hypothetical protein
VVYLKSIAAGLVALVVSAVIVPVVVAIFLRITMKPAPGELIGWDPVSLVRAYPVAYLLPVIIFLAGFIWEFRRASR